MPSPLEGITVLDFTSYIAGPFCPVMLADMGADVIKIEAHGGDPTRAFPSSMPNGSRLFEGVNRNKRGLRLDLKQAAGREVVYRLVRQADVVVENFRPGTAERLQIGYDDLRQRQPKLIYCGISGYGSNGPLSGKPGFDQVLQAMTGIAAAQGRSLGRPMLVGGSIVDFFAAMLATYGVMLALFVRERTGEGQRVDTSLLAAALSMQAGRYVASEHEPLDNERDLDTGISGLYACREGHLYISAHVQKFWLALCDAVELPELAGDPRYDTMRKRSTHAQELRERLEAVFQTKSADEWAAKLEDAGVPSAAAGAIHSMFAHPQVLANELVEQVAHPALGTLSLFGLPLKLSATPGSVRCAAPVLGQHSEEILAAAGYDAQEIAALRESRVI
jgi:crotonobetainyl-CoA:carnitine CoA-transferase CaiB-like acyl-CoA transferase